MTIEEYWRMFDLVRGDVKGTIASHAAYFKMRSLGAADSKIFQKYNRTPDLWRLNSHAYQTTFFISLGRVFDRRNDAWSIYDLTEKTAEYVGWFSKAALRERKRAESSKNGEDPEWLDKYIAEAWEPTRNDLQALRQAIVPYADKYNRSYQPIRHINYAHRGKATAADIQELFGKTQIGEATEIIRFLFTLTSEITNLYWNGRKPDLTNYGPYDAYVKNLSNQMEALVGALP